MRNIRFKAGTYYQDFEYEDEVTDDEIDEDFEAWLLNISGWEED